MKLDNVRVYDFTETLLASGYPMRIDTDPKELDEKDYKRALYLTKASNGNGAHAQFLTGIRVSFDLTCTNKMWVEAERYRFLEFVSSQSTMHRASKFDIRSQCCKYVTEATINEAERLKQQYLDNPTPENYLYLLYNLPSGFEITARMTTNYRCLLNIYVQRHNHRLPEWREFCQELLMLPYFKELVDAYYSNKKVAD